MRIERVERLRIDRWLFVRIYTDSGLVGLGEAGMWGYPDATARAISLPIATGERLQNIWEFRELLTCGGARYLRIDPCLAGGLSAAKKVAGLAESFDAELIPHGALSSVATAIAVQLDACIPNFVLQDYLGDDQPPKNDFLVENLRLEDGYLVVPERPGIGVELKPGLAERYPPTLRRPDPALHEDGSVADR